MLGFLVIHKKGGYFSNLPIIIYVGPFFQHGMGHMAHYFFILYWTLIIYYFKSDK